jgi:hypothetical protein
MMRSGRRVAEAADAVTVVPDRVNAEPLGCHDFPFKIVADHPGLARSDAEHFHRTIVGSLLGLAEAVLTLNLDVVETVFGWRSPPRNACSSSTTI